MEPIHRLINRPVAAHSYARPIMTICCKRPPACRERPAAGRRIRSRGRLGCQKWFMRSNCCAAVAARTGGRAGWRRGAAKCDAGLRIPPLAGGTGPSRNRKLMMAAREQRCSRPWCSLSVSFVTLCIAPGCPCCRSCGCSANIAAERCDYPIALLRPGHRLRVTPCPAATVSPRHTGKNVFIPSRAIKKNPSQSLKNSVARKCEMLLSSARCAVPLGGPL